MTKVYLFDFGNIFLNLDLSATKEELMKFGLTEFTAAMTLKNQAYEKGLISTTDFLDFYKSKFPNATKTALKNAWNKILLDFPEERLLFLENFTKTHTCMLLSNINDLHLEYIKASLSKSFYKRFLACFDAVYYSHLINMRKPDNNIYNFVLSENNLKPNEIFFIDDTKENIDAAFKLGFKTWHLVVGKDDVIQLKNKINI